MAVVGDIIRSVITYSSPGASEQQNVFYHLVDVAGIGNPALLTEMANWATVDWGALWAQIASQDSTMVDIAVDLMNPDGTVQVNVGVETIGLVGGVTDTPTSAAVSAYLLAQTALPKSRGSKYVPAIAESEINQGVFTLTAVVIMLSMSVIYVAPVTTAVGAILRAGVLTRLTQIFNEFLLEASVTDVPAYQRRRKPNVGS